MNELEKKALAMITKGKKRKYRTKLKIIEADGPGKMPHLKRIYKDLKKGKKIYYSTMFVESLKFNFKEQNGVPIYLELAHKDNDNLYKLSL